METERAAHIAQHSSGLSEGTHMTYVIVLKYMGQEKRTWICHKAWDLVGTSWDEESKFVSRTFTVSHHISNQSLQAEEHSAGWLLQL